MEEICYYDEKTLFKFQVACRDVGLEDDVISEVITGALNAGLLFRERLPYI